MSDRLYKPLCSLLLHILLWSNYYSGAILWVVHWALIWRLELSFVMFKSWDNTIIQLWTEYFLPKFIFWSLHHIDGVRDEVLEENRIRCDNWIEPVIMIRVLRIRKTKMSLEFTIEKQLLHTRSLYQIIKHLASWSQVPNLPLWGMNVCGLKPSVSWYYIYSTLNWQRHIPFVLCYFSSTEPTTSFHL